MPKTLDLFKASEEDLIDLSTDQIAEKLSEIRHLAKRLEEARLRKDQMEKHEFAQHLREQIQAQGYALQDVVELLSGGRGRGRKSSPKASVVPYADPDNPDNTYVRGPFKQWMKDKMRARGMDPEQKTERKAFLEWLRQG